MEFHYLTFRDEAQDHALSFQRISIFFHLCSTMFLAGFCCHRLENQCSAGIGLPGLLVCSRHFSDNLFVLDGLARPMSIEQDVHHYDHIVTKVSSPLARNAFVCHSERGTQNKNQSSKQASDHDPSPGSCEVRLECARNPDNQWTLDDCSLAWRPLLRHTPLERLPLHAASRRGIPRGSFRRAIIDACPWPLMLKSEDHVLRFQLKKLDSALVRLCEGARPYCIEQLLYGAMLDGAISPSLVRVTWPRRLDHNRDDLTANAAGCTPPSDPSRAPLLHHVPADKSLPRCRAAFAPAWLRHASTRHWSTLRTGHERRPAIPIRGQHQQHHAGQRLDRIISVMRGILRGL